MYIHVSIREKTCVNIIRIMRGQNIIQSNIFSTHEFTRAHDIKKIQKPTRTLYPVNFITLGCFHIISSFTCTCTCLSILNCMYIFVFIYSKCNNWIISRIICWNQDDIRKQFVFLYVCCGWYFNCEYMYIFLI